MQQTDKHRQTREVRGHKERKPGERGGLETSVFFGGGFFGKRI